jgi:hypothetical protein
MTIVKVPPNSNTDTLDACAPAAFVDEALEIASVGVTSIDA